MNDSVLTSAAEDTGTLEPCPEPLPAVVVETMKMVFRETHGGEMTPEDRDYLGITECEENS
jgi:hypothetical protein